MDFNFEAEKGLSAEKVAKAQEVIKRVASLEALIDEWVVLQDNELEFGAGADDNGKHDSVAVLLKEEGTILGCLYVPLAKVKELYPKLRAITEYVPNNVKSHEEEERLCELRDNSMQIQYCADVGERIGPKEQFFNFVLSYAICPVAQISVSLMDESDFEDFEMESNIAAENFILFVDVMYQPEKGAKVFGEMLYFDWGKRN